MSDDDVRYPPAELAELPDDIRAMIEEQAERAGFIPNVFLAMARRPAEFRAFFAYHEALMDKDTGGLSKADREMIVTATSAANDCLYCVVAHGALLRIYAKDFHIADKVAVNHRAAGLPERQRVMLDFALKVCTAPGTVEDADFDVLHAQGFDDEDIWDITAITGFYGLSNRLATVTGMRPNPEFYLLGRMPRS
ncbi:peroxidase-related enzyme [Brevibacterium sp. R8603A2]|uniref:peroxidase-related enzyme n=1 Tax=Brevibacterium sp. R8603A2 TaxID=2929779 RepID=UPI001FF99ED8|nr:peroxidase-related enzyme [Brevibacterium sp. R8603A2]MCK1802891.1 peroxidase-related enzyme [Brevibacterium sp. R8603A2]